MRSLLLAALGALLLAVPAAADGSSSSGVCLRGTVTERQAQGRITVTSARLAHVLKLGTVVRPIRVGMRVELRGTGLRRHGEGSRLLARGVTVVSSMPLVSVARDDDEDVDEDEPDELEVRGRITSLSPLTVGTATCAVPAGTSLAGFAVGDFVEMECDRVHGQWVLRKLESEDDDENEVIDDDHDHSGPGGGGHDNDRGGHGGHGG
jgi:hypothetical protein